MQRDTMDDSATELTHLQSLKPHQVRRCIAQVSDLGSKCSQLHLMRNSADIADGTSRTSNASSMQASQASELARERATRQAAELQLTEALAQLAAAERRARRVQLELEDAAVVLEDEGRLRHGAENARDTVRDNCLLALCSIVST